MSCTTHTAVAAFPPTLPRVRRPLPGLFVTLLLLWEAFQEARAMSNAARKAFPFGDA